MTDNKNTYRCIITGRTVYLEPTVSWSPRSHGLQRRRVYFEKHFPDKTLVWVHDIIEWEMLKKSYAVTTFIVEENKLQQSKEP